MSLESVFRLSLIMNMVDNITGPIGRISSSVNGGVSRLQKLESAFGGMVKTGAVMTELGSSIAGAALAPVEATFETRRALGELASLGVKDLEAVEDAARSFSDQWAGTSKADFISASYDIKSGIASLTDEGVADFTTLAALTGKATKSTVGEMTSLFATGYGIYKGFYDDLTDLEFGEMFSAGISKSVQQFKTTGSEMAAAIESLGASATNAKVPLEEQLSVLGMLQATMSGSEAGTKYAAFIQSAAKGGEELGLAFVDANNQIKSLPEILDLLRGKYGDTIDAIEKQEIATAFGTDEAVDLIDLLYSKTGELQDNVLSLYDAMGQGTAVASEMASAMNETEPEKFERLQQQLHNVAEAAGSTLLPVVNDLMEGAAGVIQKGAEWVENHQNLVRIILLAALTLGGFLAVAGTCIAVVGGVGIVFTKTAGLVKGFIGVIRGLPDLFETIALYGMEAGDAIRNGFNRIRTAGSTAVTAVKNVTLRIAGMAKTAVISGVTALKNMALGLVSMARQAVVTAVTAMPGLIASVWSFTAALLANPITWVVVGIVALIAALILLWQNWDSVTAFLQNAWDTACSKITAGLEWLKQGFQSIMDWMAARDHLRRRYQVRGDGAHQRGQGHLWEDQQPVPPLRCQGGPPEHPDSERQKDHDHLRRGCDPGGGCSSQRDHQGPGGSQGQPPAGCSQAGPPGRRYRRGSRRWRRQRLRRKGWQSLYRQEAGAAGGCQEDQAASGPAGDRGRTGRQNQQRRGSG